MGGYLRDATTETPVLPFGELFRERRHLRGDLRLLRRAIREGWQIAPTSRDALVQAVGESVNLDSLADLPEGTRFRAVLRAVWCAIEMEEDNRAADHAEAGQPFRPVIKRPRRRYD